MKRFKPKKQKDLIKVLKKIFNLEDNHISEKEALKMDNCNILDPSNVCAIEAKSEEAKRVLNRFIDEDMEYLREMPNLNYEDYLSSDGCIYTAEYMGVIMEIFNISNDRQIFRIKIGRDYPATLEDENFKVVLAPRVDMD